MHLIPELYVSMLTEELKKKKLRCMFAETLNGCTAIPGNLWDTSDSNSISGAIPFCHEFEIHVFVETLKGKKPSSRESALVQYTNF